MAVNLSLAGLIFTNPAYTTILRRIVLLLMGEHGGLARVCRNVYQLFTGDIELYYRYFHAFYNIPVPPPSLDHTGTRPDDLPSAPAVQYMEAVWTEESLQMVGSMLVRCVHTQGEVTAIRDGYMVTLGHVEGRPTAWTVWYLPQWAEVTSSYKVNRNRTLDARQDVLMVKDLKMSTRPMDATENQRLWTWEFELGATIAAAAIHPEDNLLVVEVAQTTTRYSVTGDKIPSTTGRRHRIYFFQLRPVGLAADHEGGEGQAVRSAPVPHRLAARPHVDLIEPGVQPTAPACAYRLKIGSHGKVGFLLLSKDGQERSGPVALWDWRLGECIGYITPRPGKVNLLDFEWFAHKHVLVIEAYAPGPPSPPSASNTPEPSPLSLQLMMIRLGGSFPTNKAITVPVSIKVHHKNPKGIAAEPLPHAWITSDLRHDKACYMTTLLLPSIERTLRMSPQQVPLATLYARISFAPALINDRYSQIAVSIGCKSDGKGTASSAVVRGAIRVDFSLAIPIAHRERAFKRAFERWLSQASILEGKDHCKSVISTAFGALKWRGLDLWGLAFTNDYVLIDAARSFQDLITTTASMGVEERQDTLHQADPDTARLSESPQPDITAALGGPEAGAAQAEMFARLIPPLEYTYAEAEAVPYREWVSASHFWITPSGQEMDVHGARIVYLDESGAAALAGKNLRDGLPAELSNRRCHLVMRNYACGDRYTQDNTMRATQWWAPGDSDKNEDPNVKNSMPRFPRHTNCQGTWVHPPWLGPIMDMHAALDGSEPFPPRRGGRPNGGRSVPRHENPDGGGQETDQGRLL